MINIDTEFKRKVDYDTNETETGVSTSVASINTREVQKEEVITVVPEIHIGKEFRMDVQPFINRPFFLESITWDSTTARYSLLNLTKYKMPNHIITSNSTLMNGLKVGTLYRMAGKLNISVAGTITHAGCVLVGLIPPLPSDINYTISQEFLVNTILSGPHGFLFANEATSIMLDIPWYCNTDLDSLNVDPANSTALNLNIEPANCATLVMMVLNPLQPSTGSSTSLTIVTEANLTNLEVYVPSPQYVTYSPQSYFSTLGTGLLDSATKYAKKLTGDAIDGLRAGVRYYTGLHNPNVPPLISSHLISQRNRLNNIDAPSYMEVLDPNANFTRIVKEPIFNTKEDEMAIGHIIKKRQYIGMFRVNQSDAVGTFLFSRPISPFQGGMRAQSKVATLANYLCNNLELLHYYTRGWKGTIKIHIQSVMNNKQQVKLRLLQLYNPSKSIVTGQPVYGTILQAPSHLLEFSAGGQEQVIELPFLSRNKIMPCARDSIVEALLHGMYYIYVAQPLANSADSPADIYFNVYMSLGDDFTFYGYSTELADALGPFRINTVLPTLIKRDKRTIDKLDHPQEKDDSVIAHALEDQEKEQQENGEKKKNEEKLQKEKDAITKEKEEADKKAKEKEEADKKAKEQESKVRKPRYIDEFQPQSYVHRHSDERERSNMRRRARYIVRIVNCLCACVRAWKDGCEEDEYEPQSIDVMNEPQKQVRENNGKIHLETDTRMLPLVDVRPLIRRLYLTDVPTMNLTVGQAGVLAVALDRYLGESIDKLATPSIACCKMYYGKEAGIKMRVKVRMTTGVLPYLNIKFFYCPPQLYPKIDVAGDSVIGASVATANDGFISSSGQYPMNNVSVHAVDNYNYIYEFTIPNTQFFKFVGGPNKMLFSNNALSYILAAADMGSLIVAFSSPVAATVELAMEASLTDESRLGFHSIAPVIIRKTQATTPVSLLTSSKGSADGSDAYPAIGLNGYVYASRS